MNAKNLSSLNFCHGSDVARTWLGCVFGSGAESLKVDSNQHKNNLAIFFCLARLVPIKVASKDS